MKALSYFSLATFLLVSNCLYAQEAKLVKNITVPFSLNGPAFMTVFNGKLCFSDLITSLGGYEPWISDGTNAGTMQLKDISPSTTPGYISSNPDIGFGTVYNNEIYFKASDSATGQEMWVSDGTTAGTRLLKDIWPGPTWGIDNNTVYITSPRAVANNLLLFTANDSVHGKELWATNGTTAGTYMVKDLNAFGLYTPDYFCVFKNKLYFSIATAAKSSELWCSDGTAAGTTLVHTFNNQLLRSVATDGSSLILNIDFQLGFSDGTPTGLYLIPGFQVENDFYVANNGKIYFSGGTPDFEPCVTDKTVAGTRVIKDLFKSGGSHPKHFVSYGQQIVFSADNDTIGRELWITDGTAGNTRLIKDFNAAPIQPGFIEASTTPVVYKNRLYFTAANNQGFYLWTSDGTTAGTVPLMTHISLSINPISYRTGMTVLDTSLYFTANYDNLGYEPYRLDTTCDPTPASFTYTGGGSSPVFQFTYTGSMMYDSLRWDFGDGTTSSQMNPSHSYAVAGVQNVCVTIYNTCGTTQNCQSITVPVGVVLFNSTAINQVWPNPVGSTLFIDGHQNATAALIDALGKHVRQWPIATSHDVVDVSGLPSGVYFLELRTSNAGSKTYRLLKN